MSRAERRRMQRLEGDAQRIGFCGQCAHPAHGAERCTRRRIGDPVPDRPGMRFLQRCRCESTVAPMPPRPEARPDAAPDADELPWSEA